MKRNLTLVDKIWDIYYTIRRGAIYVWDTPLRVKWFFQRGWRGYSDRDIWSFDHYLAEVISKGTKKLWDIHHGCPADLFKCRYNHEPDKCKECEQQYGKCNACEDWGKVLNTISNGFLEYKRDILDDELLHELFKNRTTTLGDNGVETTPEVTKEEWDEYHRKREVAYNKFVEEVIPLFGKYFPNLWD